MEIPLARNELVDNPVEQFASWFVEAEARSDITYPNAMSIACIDTNGYPDVRTVLLKEFNEEGFTFYTSIGSVKGRSLAFLPRAAACFYWEPLDRQVRLKGDVRIVSRETSNAYFATRARSSQIGAWASMQSEELESREELEKRVAYYEQLFEGREVPRPAHWVGIKIKPFSFHFWQQRPYRLHDSFLYTKESDGSWSITRRYP